ncbi:MAG: O-antigen ligase family protein [Paenibacillaceae bacterium]|nr:O-antigen ligase family protein [Paenibacillaceae bacterium]
MLYTLIGSTVLSPYIGIVMAIVYLAVKYRDVAWQELSKHTLTIGLLMLAVWSSVTSIIDGRWISLSASVILWFYLAVVLYLQSERFSLERCAKFADWTMLCGILSSVIGFLQFEGWIGQGNHIINYLIGLQAFVPDPEGRMTATFGNANLAGAWFSFLILLAVHSYHQTKHILRKNVYLVLLISFSGSLVLTGSRGAIVGLLSGLFIFCFFSFRHLRAGLVTLFASLGFLFLMHPELLPREGILRESMMDRWTIWKICFQLFLHHPLDGVGLANTYFVDAVETSYYRIAHAHNTVLAMFVELGVVGGAIFLWMHWSVARNVFGLYRANHRSIPLIFGTFTFFFVHGLVDYTLLAPQVGIVYIALTGLVMRLWKEHQLEQARIEEMRREWLQERARRAAKAVGI